jgi:cytochrome c oxidase subunit 2
MNEEVTGATLQMPAQASTLAPTVDSLYYDIYWISVAFFVAIVGCMVLFAWRFRRRKGVTSKPPGHHNALELFWTFSPLILLAYMFHQGFEGFMYMSVPPENSLNIRVQASQWRWQFVYPNLEDVPDSDLWVPDGQPVRLIMSSSDVLHSFFVPSLRVKRDLVPGMYTSLWFEPTRASRPARLRNQPWVQDIFCAEYCGAPENPDDGVYHANGRPRQGLGHSGMWSRIHIVSRSEWNAHMDELERSLTIPAEYHGDYAAWGHALFPEKGCPTCHVTEAGVPHTTGPNLHDVAGYVQPLEGGGQEMANLEYFRTALREPQAHVVRGFGNGTHMPLIAMPEIHRDALIAYVASLSDRGQPLVQEITTLHSEQNH